jgi:predicted nuclease with TOPRIM domain
MRQKLERLQELEAHEAGRARLLTRAAELLHSNAEYRDHVSRLHGEIGRLNGLLDRITASRTWRLHQWLERLRGRS